MTAVTRIVSFAGNGIAIDCSDLEVAAIVDGLSQHMLSERPVTTRMRFTLDRGNSGEYRFVCGGELAYAGACRGAVTSMLLDRVLYHLADSSRGGVLFHAASVARGGRGVLLPGESGSGKTTVAAWLTSRGYDYLTDELVFVPAGSSQIEPFRRPLNVKHPGRPPLAGVVDFDADGVVHTPEGFLVPPKALNSASRGSAATLSLIVFPRFEESAPLSLERLTPARAGMLLMASLVNAPALPEHGFADSARLARTLPAYSMTYGDLAEVATRMDALLEDR